jgi:hypothetical protein
MELFRSFYRGMKGPSKFCVVKAVGGWDATVAERSARKTFCHGADCAPQRFQSSGFPHLHRPCWKQVGRFSLKVAKLQELLLRYWTLDRGCSGHCENATSAGQVSLAWTRRTKGLLLGRQRVGWRSFHRVSSRRQKMSTRNTMPDEVVVRYNNPRVDGLTLLNSKMTQTQQSRGISL